MSHHHHEPGILHPEAGLPPSLLRLSLLHRLALVTAVAAAVWAVVAWAIL